MFRNMFSSGLSSGLILLCFELCVGNKLDSIWSSNLDCSTSSPNPCDVLQNICGPSGVCVASGCSYNCMCPGGSTGSNCDSAPPSSGGSGSEPTTSTGTVNEKRLPDIFGNGTLNYLVNLLKVETSSQSTTTVVATTVTVLSPNVSSGMQEAVSDTVVVANEKTTVVPKPAAIIASTDAPYTKDATKPQDHVIGIAAPLIGQILTTTTARPSSIVSDMRTKTTYSVPEVANQQKGVEIDASNRKLQMQQGTTVTTSSGTTPVVTEASATNTTVDNERPTLIAKTVSAVSENPTPATKLTSNPLQDSQSVQTTTAIPKASEGVTETSPKAEKDVTTDTVVTKQSAVPASLDTLIRVPKVSSETPLPTTTPTPQHKTSAGAATSETKASEKIAEMPIMSKTSHGSTTAAPINTPGIFSTGQPSETTTEQAKTTEKGALRAIVTQYPADSQLQSTKKAQLTTPPPTPLVNIESARLQSLRTTIQTNAESTTSDPKEVTDVLLVSGAAATNSKSERNKAKYTPKDTPEIQLTKENPPSEDPKKVAKAVASPTEVNLFMTTAPPASVNNVEIPQGSLTSVNNENLLINEKSPPSAVADSDQVKTNTIPRDTHQTNDNTLSAANNIDNTAFSKGYMSQDGQVLKDLFQDLPVIPTASLVKSSKVLNPKIEPSKISFTPDKPEQLQTVHGVQNINIQPFRNSVTPKTNAQQQTIQGTQHINNESFRTSVAPKTSEEQQTMQGTQQINNESFRTSVTPKTTEQQQTVESTQNINNESFRTSVTPKTTEQQQTVQSTQNIDIAISEKPVSEQTTDDNSHETDDETLPSVEKTTPTTASSDDDDNGLSGVDTVTTPPSTVGTTPQNKRNKREAKAFLQYLFRGAFFR